MALLNKTDSFDANDAYRALSSCCGYGVDRALWLRGAPGVGRGGALDLIGTAFLLDDDSP